MQRRIYSCAAPAPRRSSGVENFLLGGQANRKLKHGHYVYISAYLNYGIYNRYLPFLLYGIYYSIQHLYSIVTKLYTSRKTYNKPFNCSPFILPITDLVLLVLRLLRRDLSELAGSIELVDLYNKG